MSENNDPNLGCERAEMDRREITVIGGAEVALLLAGLEHEILQTVHKAYEIHGSGNTCLPHSVFLRFPEDPRNRIISLPAYLGGDFNVAGMKWIASFPGNVSRGLDRASAVIILNSMVTGMPQAIIEGSIISAKRTAASAALAAQYLHGGTGEITVGIIGCGVINYELVKFLRRTRLQIKSIVIFDTDKNRAVEFDNKLRRAFYDIDVKLAANARETLERSHLISLGTTAAQPYIYDLSGCMAGSTILNISLRDLSPETILSCDNVVDDIDHVCRASTSIHLAEQLTGNRDFIRCAISDILTGNLPARAKDKNLVVFSPFGLGILDIALGMLVLDLATHRGCGMIAKSFLPEPWSRRI